MRAYTTVGLGFGDEGKGTIVDALVRKHGIKLVVRYSGGAQCAHSVISPDGIHHTFAQFGSGTLAEAATILSKHVLVDPYRLLNEREILCGKGAYPTIYVDEDALVITPFHQALNQIRESLRSRRHGSCGIGIGETARYALEHPETALRIGDLYDFSTTRDKLIHIRAHLAAEAEVLNEKSDVKMGSTTLSTSNSYVIDALLYRYHRFLSVARVASTHRILDLISRNDTVFEGAQGILLDEDYGFHPHTTWSRVTLRNAHEMLAEAGVTDIVNYGVLRAHHCRHGAGPFPTEDNSLNINEPHNGVGEYQGAFRHGHFDLTLAKYAMRVSSGTTRGIYWKVPPIDMLAITHMDNVSETWRPVIGYGISLNEIPAYDDWSKRERLTSCLSGVTKDDWTAETVGRDQVADWIQERLGRPVAIRSFGPSYKDKVFD